MIHINTNNSPDILRLWADENWENGIGDFETFEKELLKLKMLNKKCILVWSNPNHTEDDEGGFPPMTSFFQIVKSLFFCGIDKKNENFGESAHIKRTSSSRISRATRGIL